MGTKPHDFEEVKSFLSKFPCQSVLVLQMQMGFLH